VAESTFKFSEFSLRKIRQGLRTWTLLEKLPVAQPRKNCPAFYETRKFITVFTRPQPQILFLYDRFQYYPRIYFYVFFLIPSGFPTKSLYISLLYVLHGLPIACASYSNVQEVVILLETLIKPWSLQRRCNKTRVSPHWTTNANNWRTNVLTWRSTQHTAKRKQLSYDRT
jgi:hypothetical protein